MYKSREISGDRVITVGGLTIIMSVFIESVVNHDKNEFTNKRHLLVCSSAIGAFNIYLTLKMTRLNILIIVLCVMKR